ncbi:MAG: hypothetical protein A3J74_01340 [Elusimicrobia bacterium RIFCSPHIGHO2_02_FULL_57_9]|nr:MAG: hypothetical protein A3J74_01340 [Elusimicrobia bacterium RIFCSPHIGHO2_02_FULL_57_9]
MSIRISLINGSSGEESLLERLSSPDSDDKPYYSGVFKHWYPREPRFSGVVPIDMIWSDPYKPKDSEIPFFEKPETKKNPEQTKRNPRYYSGPYGRYGFAIHTDRWSDKETAQDEKMQDRPELRNFLFRDTNGCLKVYPDCLNLINVFIDEQSAKGRKVQVEVREIK